jgi:hypothetical protein
MYMGRQIAKARGKTLHYFELQRYYMRSRGCQDISKYGSMKKVVYARDEIPIELWSSSLKAYLPP